MTKNDMKAALRAGKTPAQLQAEVFEAHNQLLAEDEADNAHKNPMARHRLDQGQWQAHRAHMMDGGGVEDPTALGLAVLQALMDNDQEAYWSERDHFVKSFLKSLRHVTRNASGLVTYHGAGPKPVLPPSV